MRILQLAPVWETVPPPAYGGTEAVVHDLTEELVRRGHDVTLFASGDSKTSAVLSSTCPRSLRKAYAGDLAQLCPHDWLHVSTALRHAGEFDIVHNHAGELAMAFAGSSRVPMLSTTHCPVTESTGPIWDGYTGYYNTISRAQAQAWPETAATFAGAIYNGIDVDSFPYCDVKDDFLLFVGRIAEQKAPHLAIRAARLLGKRIVLAGKIDWRDEPYFNGMVRSQIDGEQVVFMGEADARLKRELYKRATCLLMPLCWDEPFGLVMTEAMACGTPVVAFARGSAPELILDGVTGYLVSDVPSMAEAVLRIDRIDPMQCRRRVERLFSTDRMVDAYLSAYTWILQDAAMKVSPRVAS